MPEEGSGYTAKALVVVSPQLQAGQVSEGGKVVREVKTATVPATVAEQEDCMEEVAVVDLMMLVLRLRDQQQEEGELVVSG